MQNWAHNQCVLAKGLGPKSGKFYKPTAGYRGRTNMDAILDPEYPLAIICYKLPDFTQKGLQYYA